MIRIRIIHANSLVLGTMFKTCYWLLGMNNSATVYFFEKYKSARRMLPGVTCGPDGKSTRHGSYQAWESTRE
jgi:hypothetical protein